MKRIAALLVILATTAVPPLAAADEGQQHPVVVIDTDMGLDDLFALCAALQSPDVAIAALQVSAGACAGPSGGAHLALLRVRVNRGDVPVYAPASESAPDAPPFRGFVEAALQRVLPATDTAGVLPFAPAAWAKDHDSITIVALGPLTNIAAALQATPEIRGKIARIVVAGAPDGWNARFDPAATQRVRESGIRMEYVVPTEAARKPEAWRQDRRIAGTCGPAGLALTSDFLADDALARHAFEQFPQLHDELAWLGVVAPDLFVNQQEGDATVRTPQAGVAERFAAELARGRARRQRVALAENALEIATLQPDLAERRNRIVAAHGPDEWAILLLTNELHDHLGVYSIIGAKMGLRAAEVLNAPPHEIRVTSHAPSSPPASCLDDGLIVSTGATPGRRLFTHDDSATPAVEAVFEYNGRRLVLGLKPEYAARIAARLKELRERYGLENQAYWTEVRSFGLDIWEQWSRCELFEERGEGRAADGQ